MRRLELLTPYMIKDGLRAPDVFISADDQVMIDLMHAAPDKVSWYLPFATTRIVVAYSPKSRFFSVLDEAAHGKRLWTEVLREPGLKIGRTDPAIDPKGYRTIIVCKLAERHVEPRLCHPSPQSSNDYVRAQYESKTLAAL